MTENLKSLKDAALIIVAVVIVVTSFVTSCGSSKKDSETITVWTNPSATTPVLPLYACASAADFDFRDWNTTMALQSLLLAGDGEFWIGHLEGFARVYRHGAPIKLLAVTGWRKWQFLSKKADGVFPEDFLRNGIEFAPSDGAGYYLLNALLKEQGVSMEVRPMEMRVALLKALDGRIDSIMLPEPFATTLMSKNLGFKRICSLEDYYGKCRNSASEVPWAGIAVNSEWAERHSEYVERILSEMLAASEFLSQMAPEEVSQFWPSEKAESSGIGRDAVAAALEHDKVKAVPAEDIISEIEDFLKVVAPDCPFDDGIIWRRRD